MKDLFLSIIIPMYNSEKYIEKNLKSIKNQNYSNYEVIIVDDGSTDNSKKILDEIIQDDARFKYYYQKNSGAPAARNYGLTKARGEYVIFFDSDDYFNDNGLFCFYEFIEELEVTPDLVVSDYTYSQHPNQPKIEQTKSMKTAKKLIRESKESNIFDFMFIDPTPNAKLIRRNFLLDKNIKFEDLRLAQDLNFYLKMLSYQPKVFFLDKITYLYNLRPDSISTSYNESLMDIIKSIKLIKQENNNYFDVENQRMNTFVFNHTSSKLIKSLKISDKKERKKVSESLSGYIMEIPKDFDANFLNVEPKTIYLIIRLLPIMTSESLLKIKPILIKLLKKARVVQ